MSLRVTWDGALPSGEPMDVVMEDCTSWAPANTVLKAGRELSSWFFKRPSTQRRPSLFSLCSSPRETEFHDTDFPMGTDISKQPLSINDLPPEVLGEIFTAYLDPPDSDDPPVLYDGARYRVSSHPGSSSSPILLGQVCSSWRTFTRSLPTLWRKISVSCPRPQDIPLFALWIERSGEMPIDLTLVDRFEATEDSTTAIREIFRVALTHSHKWNAVTFDLTTDMGDLVSSQTSPPSISLSSFDIKLPYWSETSLQLLLHLLYSSPSLRKVAYGMTLSDTTLLAILQTPNRLVQTITHLEAGNVAAEKLLQCLDQYTSLTHLSFRTTTLPIYPSPCTTPTILPNLQYLCIDHGNDIAPLLNSLCTPSLKHLVLPNGFASAHSPKSKTDEGWNALFSLMERSCPTPPLLESLSFEASGMDENIIVRAFASPFLNSLRSLHIKSKVSDRLVTALTVPRQSNYCELGLLPRLECLELSNCTSADGLLSSLITSRQGSLKRVKATMMGSESFVRDLALNIPGVDIIF